MIVRNVFGATRIIRGEESYTGENLKKERI